MNMAHFIVYFSMLLLSSFADCAGDFSKFKFNCDKHAWILNCDDRNTLIALFSENGNLFKEEHNYLKESNKMVITHQVLGDTLEQFEDMYDYMFNITREENSDEIEIVSWSQKLVTTDGSTVFLSSTLDNDSESESQSWVPRLSKNGNFLSLESASYPGYFLNIVDGTPFLQDQEYFFTGLYSNFLYDIFLKNNLDTNSNQGDIVMKYFDRKGILQEGFMCDQGWGFESAKMLCEKYNQESGLPTYNGHFTKTSVAKKLMLVGLQCTGLEDTFLQCKPQGDDCDQKLGCLAQQRIFLTSRSFDTCRPEDRAGVVCGSEEEIETILADSLVCNKTLSEKSYIAEAFKLEEEISKVKTETFRSKSWARYAETIPRIDGSMALTLVNATKMAGEVRLRKPSKGWETLPSSTKTLWSGLVKLSELFDKAFLVTGDNMHEIRYNSLAIHREIIGSIRSAFKNDPLAYLKNSNNISFYTNLNKEGMQEVLDSFDHPTNMILELLESLANEDSFAKEEKFLLQESLEQLKRQITRLNAKKMETTDQISTLTRELVNFNNTILATIDKFCSSDCVEGFNICSKCQKRETPANRFDGNNWVSVSSSNIDHCERKEEYCKSYESWSCSSTVRECEKYVDQCTKRDTSCKRTVKECSKWNHSYCSGYKSYCKRDKKEEWKDAGCITAAVFSLGFSAIADDCNRHKWVCVEYGSKCKHSPYKKCMHYQSKCAEYNNKCLNWEPECVKEVDKCTKWTKRCTVKGSACVQYKPEGYFCQDSQHLGKSCQPCSSSCKVLKDSFKMILDFSNQVQERALDFKSNNKINELLIDLLTRMKEYGQDLETSESIEEVKNIGENLNELGNVYTQVMNSLNRPKRDSGFGFSFQDLFQSAKDKVTKETTNIFEKPKDLIIGAHDLYKVSKNLFENPEDLVKNTQTVVQASKDLVQTSNEFVQNVKTKIASIEDFSKKISDFDDEMKTEFLRLFWDNVYVAQEECVPIKNCFKVNVCMKQEKSSQNTVTCVDNVQHDVCNVKCQQVKRKFQFNIPSDWRIDNLVSAIYKHGKMTSDNIALMKRQFVIQEEMKIKRNSTGVVNERMEFLLEMSRGIQDFLKEWSDLNDFFNKLSVMNSVSGMKAESFGWYKDNMDELYPDREFDEIFSEILLKETKTAVVMNIFVNFVSTTFEKFLEKYPLGKKSFVVENFDIFHDSESKRSEEREKIFQEMDEKISMINMEATRLSNSLDEKLKSNLTEVENDFICKFKSGENGSEITKEIETLYENKNDHDSFEW